jgi:type II secretory pathway pseudopilin PulG
LRTRTRSAVPPTRFAGGFSLIELLVSLTVTLMILAGVLTIFDLNTKLARAQTGLAEMQQSLRIGQSTIVRMLRMTGRGTLPVGTLPGGTAIEVCNNAQVDPGCDRTEIAIGFEDSPTIAPGTDVLTVRGVFSAPLWQVNHTDSATFSVNTSGLEITGTLRIGGISHTGVPQPTTALVEALTADPAIREPLLLTSPLDDRIFAVVEIDPETSDVSDPDNVVLGFKYSDGVRTAGYQGLTGGAAFPAELTSVAFAGILEEYRYYIRAERAVPGDETTELRPRLSMARMYPNSETPYRSSREQLELDIADNVLDLQVALGIDLDDGGTVTDDAGDEDEWLFNHPDDDADPGLWNVAGRRLSYVRVNTLARTERPERNYRSRALEAIEDRVYSEPAVPSDPDERVARMHRRRVLASIVDLRNL